MTVKGKTGGRMSAQELKFSRCFASQAKRPGLHTLLPIPPEQGEGIFHVSLYFLVHPPRTLNSRELLINIPIGLWETWMSWYETYQALDSVCLVLRQVAPEARI